MPPSVKVGSPSRSGLQNPTTDPCLRMVGNFPGRGLNCGPEFVVRRPLHSATRHLCAKLLPVLSYIENGPIYHLTGSWFLDDTPKQAVLPDFSTFRFLFWENLFFTLIQELFSKTSCKLLLQGYSILKFSVCEYFFMVRTPVEWLTWYQEETCSHDPSAENFDAIKDHPRQVEGSVFCDHPEHEAHVACQSNAQEHHIPYVSHFVL